eukprot:9862785-Alexandrium_andersonii.AAC.1
MPVLRRPGHLRQATPGARSPALGYARPVLGRTLAFPLCGDEAFSAEHSWSGALPRGSAGHA